MLVAGLDEFEFGCGPLQEDAVYYREGAQDLIRKLIPGDLLEAPESPFSQEAVAKLGPSRFSGSLEPIFTTASRARFNDILPIVTHTELKSSPCTLAIQLLCKYRQNACYFFYEMVSRWLLPQKRMNVELFFASDVRLPKLSDELLSVAEIVVQIRSSQELEEARRNLAQIVTEVRLGVVSHYHARRILEFKGLSSDGKTAMIQEKIGSLIQSRSKDFDHGIFSQMQHFLVTCRDDFKKARDYHHISRIISNLYSVQKLLKQNIEVFPAKRHVILKFLKTKLAEGRSVLGVLAGINFLSGHEVFEESHLIAAISRTLPGIRIVEGSGFSDRAKAIQTNYLEIEREGGGEFTHEEVQSLRVHLPQHIKNHIEQLAHPIFMPRNEEEVLRNIMVLGRQLRFVTDLPQMIISFDELRGQEIFFTVILLCVRGEEGEGAAELFARAPSDLKLSPERVRNLGPLGRKHAKEATVFRASLELSPFLRQDHSVDLYRARDKVVAEITRVLGEVRDYNGGMIHKQSEVLLALKRALGKTADQHSILLEKFFYSLAPVEMRSVMEVEKLKQLFLFFLQSNQKVFVKQDEKRVMAVYPSVDNEWRSRIASLRIPPHQLITFLLDQDGGSSAGLLLQSDDAALQKRLLENASSEL